MLEYLVQRHFLYNYQASNNSTKVEAPKENAGQVPTRETTRQTIPSFGVHRLRHFFASYMHDLGYSDAIIQALGGWSTDNVMKSVYRHALNEDEARKSVVNDFSFL